MRRGRRLITGAATALVALLLSAGGCGQGAPKHELTIVGTEMAFAAPTSVAAGTYEVRFRNAGKVFHEVAFREASGSVVRRISAAPGATATLSVTLSAGPYELGCFEPGHYAAGMHRPLTVR